MQDKIEALAGTDRGGDVSALATRRRMMGQARAGSMARGERQLIALAMLGLIVIAASLVQLLTTGLSGHTGVVVGLHVAGALLMTALLTGALTLLQRNSLRLRQLSEVATELGMGDLAARAPTEPLDDYGHLGLGLNVMAGRIGRLLQAQKDLLAGVSHELRSPLARIGVALELLRGELERAAEGQRDTAEGDQLIDEIAEEVNLLERHIARLLEAQRVGADGALPRRSVVTLDTLVAQVLGRERHRLERLNWRLETDLGLGEGQMMGDENALDRVVSTLIENAIRHASEGVAPDGRVVTRELRIETAADATGRAVLRVMDRGRGLDGETLGRVFEPFFRSDQSRSEVTGGTGLGLFLVKRIAEAHGGTARVMPRAGGGLIVELRLPLLGSQRDSKQTMRMTVTGEA